MSKRLIINADDYGMSAGVNRGIIEAVEAGVVTSVSAFTPPVDADILIGRCGVHLSITKDWAEQVRQFYVAGGTPTHFDSHHHMQDHYVTRDGYAGLCKGYGVAGVPLSVTQRDYLRECGIKCVDHTEIRWKDGQRETLERLLKIDFAWAQSVHLMCHPGYVDDDLRRQSAMTQTREYELAVLLDPTFKIWLRAEGIELIGYAEL